MHYAWQDFRMERNVLNYLIRKGKRKVINGKIVEIGTDSKKLYKIVGELTGKLVENPLPETETDNQLADAFADNFLNKVLNIQAELEHKPLYQPDQR